MERTGAHVPPCSVATVDVLKSSFLAFWAGDVSAHFQTMEQEHNKMVEINCQEKILLLGGDQGRWLNTPWHWFCCTREKHICSCGTRVRCMITALKTVWRREGRDIFFNVFHSVLVCSGKEEVKQKKSMHVWCWCLMHWRNCSKAVHPWSEACFPHILWSLRIFAFYIYIYIYSYYICIETHPPVCTPLYMYVRVYIYPHLGVFCYTALLVGIAFN